MKHLSKQLTAIFMASCLALSVGSVGVFASELEGEALSEAPVAEEAPAEQNDTVPSEDAAVEVQAVEESHEEEAAAAAAEEPEQEVIDAAEAAPETVEAAPETAEAAPETAEAENTVPENEENVLETAEEAEVTAFGSDDGDYIEYPSAAVVNQPVFMWASDLSSCSLMLYSDGVQVATVACTVTSAVAADDDDYMEYTATATYQGETYTDSKRVARSILYTGRTSSDKMNYRFTEAGDLDVFGLNSDGSRIQTTFSDYGYQAVVSYAGSDMRDVRFDNGSYSDGTLKITPNVVFTEDGSYAVVIYTVENLSNSSVTYSLGVHADVDIDGDDHATVSATNTGFKMVNVAQELGKVFYLACKNVLGLKNVDTMWIGTYNNQRANAFNNSTAPVSDKDSAIAYAWQNRVINVGEVARYAYEVGIGSGDAIVMPDEKIVVYGDPTFHWASDHSSCTATFTSADGEYTQSIACTIDPDEKEEETVFKATAVFNGIAYSDVVAVEKETGEEEPVVSGSLRVIDDSTDAIVDDGTHLIGSGDNLTLKCTLEFAGFRKAYVDGNLVDPSNYTAVEGSTVVTFKSSYLDSLGEGNHDVNLEYEINGRTVNMSTRINVRRAAPSDNENPGGNNGGNNEDPGSDTDTNPGTDTNSNTNTNSGSNKGNGTSNSNTSSASQSEETTTVPVETGDTSDGMLWAVLMSISLMAGALALRKSLLR